MTKLHNMYTNFFMRRFPANNFLEGEGQVQSSSTLFVTEIVDGLSDLGIVSVVFTISCENHFLFFFPQIYVQAHSSG